MSFIDRIVIATRVLVCKRILLIEAKKETDKRDSITMYGTMHDKPQQIQVLRSLADSIERDHQVEERRRLVNLSKQIN